MSHSIPSYAQLEMEKSLARLDSMNYLMQQRTGIDIGMAQQNQNYLGIPSLGLAQIQNQMDFNSQERQKQLLHALNYGSNRPREQFFSGRQMMFDEAMAKDVWPTNPNAKEGDFKSSIHWLDNEIRLTRERCYS